MPEVHMPDGSIASFPDEMPQDQIAGIIKNHIAGQNENLPGYAAPSGSQAVVPAPELPGAHAAGVAGSNLLTGALDLAGIPGTVQSALPKLSPEAEAGVAEQMGMGSLKIPALPSSEALRTGARNLGLIDQPSQQPRGEGERMLAAAARGVGGTVPLAVGGGIGALAKAAIQGATSGIGGEIGQNVLPLHTNPGIAALAGVLTGQAVGGTGYGMLSRGANAVRGVGNPVIEAYDMAGVTPALAGDVTGRPGLQALQSLGMRAPFGGRAVEAAKAGAQEFGNSIENTASSLGNSRTLTDAGLALQSGARNWFQGWRGAQQMAEGAVAAKVPANLPVDIAPIDQTLRGTIRQMPGASAVADAMTSPIFKQLGVALAHDAAPSQARTGTATVPWGSLRAWRSLVGEKLENSLVARDGNDRAWKALYGSISDALGDAASSNGAKAEWAVANAVTNKGHQFIESTLNNIINHAGAQNSIVPEAAARFALNGADSGGTMLRQLRDQMPQSVDQLAAYKLRDMATATPGRQTQEMPMSAMTFSTELNRLSPEARDALFSAVSPKLGALQTVAERGKETFQRYGNPSGTAGMTQHGGLLTAPLNIVAAGYGGHEVGGKLGAIAGAGGATLPYLTGPIAANLTARELLTRYLAAPTGGPGVTGSRMYRAAAAWPELAPFADTGQPKNANANAR